MSKTRLCICGQVMRDFIALASKHGGLHSGLMAAALGLAILAQGFDSVSAAEPDSNTNLAPAVVSENITQETLRAYLQLQEQLHVTQLALEQNRKEARETAAELIRLVVWFYQGIGCMGRQLVAARQVMEMCLP